MIPLLVIEGPTASGKSELALALAEHLDTEIISADSRQVYRYMNIGTAKPDPEAQQRIKHHLIDIIDPDQSYNAGLFVRDAEAVINKLSLVNKLPIICGGTGLYVKSLLDGLFELPDVPTDIRQTLKRRLARENSQSLYLELQSADPIFAARISSNDTQRILRGLEIYLATGKTITGHWQEQGNTIKYAPFRILIDIPRDILYSRIDSRIDHMIKRGLLDEISNLLDKGYKGTDPGLNSLGYKEFIPFLAGETTLADCREKAAQYSRNYAKRQCTWYRKYNFDLTITNPDYTISEMCSAILTRMNI